MTVAKAAEISMDFLQKLIQKQKSATESGAQERDTQYDKCFTKPACTQKSMVLISKSAQNLPMLKKQKTTVLLVEFVELLSSTSFYYAVLISESLIFSRICSFGENCVLKIIFFWLLMQASFGGRSRKTCRKYAFLR